VVRVGITDRVGVWVRFGRGVAKEWGGEWGMGGGGGARWEGMAYGDREGRWLRGGGGRGGMWTLVSTPFVNGGLVGGRGGARFGSVGWVAEGEFKLCILRLGEIGGKTFNG